MVHSHPNHMTRLTNIRRSLYTCWTLAFVALGGCAGAHAAKVRARAMKPPHSAPRSYSAPQRVPAATKEIKPLVGELMA
jgi:hypothetical protein